MTVVRACPTPEVLAAFADGAIEEPERSALAAHARGCAECLAVLDAILDETAPRRQDSELGASKEALRLALLEVDRALPAGARVGRYEIREWLGAGAMGTVYAAHDPALDRKVALKLIRAQVAGPELEVRLLREAKAMARVSHPEVIVVHDAGRDGDRLFIAMELVDGGTLRDWLAAKPRSWREILAVYVKAGRGLEQAHAAGLVHRDFKPDNVLIGNDGRPRVTDFGLAVGLDGEDPDAACMASSPAGTEALTRTGALAGTPAYMAPEQLKGLAADARSDVYAFCISLYEALYGQRPFEGQTLVDLRDAKSAGVLRPLPPSRNVPASLRRALLVGIRADPQSRYGSMGDLLRALTRATRRSAHVIGGVAALTVAIATLGTLAARHHPRPTPVASAPAPECTTNRACIDSHAGAPYVCRPLDQRCAPVASEDCTPMFEAQDLAAEDTVWLGAMFPVKEADYGAMNMSGADFARQEIAEVTRSLDGTHASKRVRRIGLVACDDGADAMRAARHLVDDVGVPAILGFGSGQKVVDIAGSLLIERGVVTVASLTSSPLITRLPQSPKLPKMVWRTTYSLDLLAEATAKIVEEALAPRRRNGHARVTLVHRDTAAAASFADALSRVLRLNGRSALASGQEYDEVTLSKEDMTPEQTASVARRIAQRSPTFIVLPADPPILPLMEEIEAHSKGETATYVVAAGTTTALTPFFEHSEERRHRVFVVQSVSDSPANARFVIRYNERHAEKVGRTFNPGSSYDAFYLLADAVFALGDEPIRGPELASAFARLMPPGPTIEVGPLHVFDAIAALSEGRSIDLDGATSGLNFDLTTGEAPSDFELLCAGVGANGQPSHEDVASGVVYRSAIHRSEGVVICL